MNDTKIVLKRDSAQEEDEREDKQGIKLNYKRIPELEHLQSIGELFFDTVADKQFRIKCLCYNTCDNVQDRIIN